MPDIIADLVKLSTAPSEKSSFDEWLKGDDALTLLKGNQQDEFVVYVGMDCTFIHAVSVSAQSLKPPNVEDLMDWNFNAASSWGICHTFSDPPEISISPPLDHTGSKTLDRGEQLVFARSFEGHIGAQSYFEVLQKFVHLFGLHFVSERNAYCRLDNQGNIEAAIRIVEVPPSRGDTFGGTIVLFNRDLLDQYMVLTDSIIVRMFDFTRFRASDFHGWHLNPTVRNDGDIFFRAAVEPGHASYMRGFQIVRPLSPREIIVKRILGEDDKEREYASFIAYDFKNKVIREISTDPQVTANYFTKSDLPFETSPAFFRPEVLTKYKADAEKYRLTDRSIHCRGAWCLEAYDINEVDEVHGYIVDLRRLPYEEQLHWKAYNEEPKGRISRRAYKTDFEGSWEIDYDPLPSLKEALQALERKGVDWWKLRDESLFDRVHYPVTTSAAEWANEIMQLDQLAVEGFEEKWLRSKAESLGQAPAQNLRSLKLVEICLTASGFEEDHAREIVAPLHQVHELRSKLKGHASGKEATAIKKEVLREHRSYKDHFRHLCTQCDESIRAITKVFEKLNEA